MPSYTYELPEQSILLSNIRQNLLKVGAEWVEVGAFMREGHVEYAPIRNNPILSINRRNLILLFISLRKYLIVC
jgi:hypothetical protein